MIKLSKFKKDCLGFTLIELMVVIAIVGILAGIVTITVTSTLPDSRDGRRIADVETVESALEQYFTDNKTYIRPFTCVSDANSYCYEDTTYATMYSINTLLTQGYLKSDVNDPTNNTTYRYKYGTPFSPNPPDEYIFFARLEKKTAGENIYQLYDTSGNPVAGTYYYAVFSDYNHWYNNFRDHSLGNSCPYADEWGHMMSEVDGCLYKTW